MQHHIKENKLKLKLFHLKLCSRSTRASPSTNDKIFSPNTIDWSIVFVEALSDSAAFAVEFTSDINDQPGIDNQAQV